MKKIIWIITLIAFTSSFFFLFDSCKKETQDYAEADFINELKRGWYVSRFEQHQDPYCPTVILFNGDSSVMFGGYHDTEYNINDPKICTFNCVEYIQFWTITESNNQYHLRTEDICGEVNTYIFSYENYHSTQQLYAPDIYIMYADVKLICQDTTITFYQFKLSVNVDDPSSSKIFFEFEGRDPSCDLVPDE